MARLLVCALLFAALLGTSFAALPDSIKVTDFTPKWAGVGGDYDITVTGCGFRTYSSVVCVWGYEFVALKSEIISDTEIRCTTGAILPSEVEAIPFTTKLSLIFEGDATDEELVMNLDDDFVFGPAVTDIQPRSGPVGGGNQVIIQGRGFDDWQRITVEFNDGSFCTNVQVAELGTAISCIAPAGSFNEDARVTLKFNDDDTIVVHSTITYHYGPVVTTVTPGCSAIIGGTVLTITGTNFDDPVIAPNANPLQPPEVFFSFTGAPQRYNGTNVVFDPTTNNNPNNPTQPNIRVTTPRIDNADVFGLDVNLFIHFKGVNSKVSAGQVRYGPIVYNAGIDLSGTFSQNPVPNESHRNGGDLITITGCGFSFFPQQQVEPILNPNGGGNALRLCNRGAAPGSPGDTLEIIPGANGNANLDTITCTARPILCERLGTLDRSFQVRFQNLGLPAYQASYNLPDLARQPTEQALSFTVGPIVENITPNGGKYTGGETITATGKNFFFATSNSAAVPGWVAKFIFRDYDPVNTFTRTATAQFISDTEIVATVPAAFWGVDTRVKVDFEPTTGNNQDCFRLPREDDNKYRWSFGPTCSSIFPSNDWLSGNRQVSLSGSALNDGGIPEVRVCLDRLNPGTCTIYETVSQDSAQFSVTSDAISLVTPDIRQNVKSKVGGNRLFGDSATFVLVYPNVPAAALLGGTASITCAGSYRFGPVVNEVTPCKGAFGPRGPSQPSDPVQILGSGFNGPITRLNTDVLFGDIFGVTAAVNGDSLVRATTRWGGPPNTQVGVTTIFNTCNTTYSSKSVWWGPSITKITELSGRAPIQSANNPNEDVWGVLPTGGQSVTVTGQNFAEFAAGNIKCMIDGVFVATDLTNAAADDTVVCTTPARPFGTIAKLTLFFGTIPGGQPSDWNWRQILNATQTLIYKPRIDDVQPRFGLTSGGTDVTITGEGFTGWPAYECLFGGIYSGADATADNGGTTVSCSTPTNRGEFNTDVLVTVQLVDAGTGVFDDDQRVNAPVEFHYGPVCQDVSPSIGPVGGANAITIQGSGFQDCMVSNTVPFRDCIFQNITAYLVDVENNTRIELPLASNDTLAAPNTATTYTITSMPARPCMENAVIEIVYNDAIVINGNAQRTVRCPAVVGNRPYFYHYGPIFTEQTSEFHRNGISYGAEGTIITITGEGFADPGLSSPRCRFGDISNTTVAATGSDTTITCAAPKSFFNDVVEVFVEWGAANGTANGDCTRANDRALKAGFFHYGPVLDSITPKRGNVLARDPVTIAGFAFGCCGFTSFQCNWGPDVGGTDYSLVSTRTDNQVVCPPPNNTFIDVRYDNVGVFFGGSNLFSDDLTTQFLTEEGDVLSYYYGPIITDYSPKRTKLSGADTITFTGEGFNDPFFVANSARCVFTSAINGVSYSFTSTVNSVSADGTTITCQNERFAHDCGAVDNIQVTWTRAPDSARQLRAYQGNNYWKTVEIPPTVIAIPPQKNDGGSTTTDFKRLEYGPTITDVTVSTGAAPADQLQGVLRSNMAGGLTVTITGNGFSDWIDPENMGNYGTERALCRFGGRSSTLAPNGNNGDLAPTVIASDTEIQCNVPPGAFEESGLIGVIFDPHFDVRTQQLPRLGTDAWRWMPYASSLSRKWGSTSGYETTVVEGEGFSEYKNVICLFNDDEAVESDIIDDFFVACLTPPSVPEIASVTLLFCNPTDTCSCETCVNDIDGSGDGVAASFMENCLLASGASNPNACFSQCVGFGFTAFACSRALPIELGVEASYTYSAGIAGAETDIATAFAQASQLPSSNVYVFTLPATTDNVSGGVVLVAQPPINTVDIRTNLANNQDVLTQAGITNFEYLNLHNKRSVEEEEQGETSLFKRTFPFRFGFWPQDHAFVNDEYTYAGIRSFLPPAGPTCGETSITLTGFGFDLFEDFVCRIGGVTSPGFRFDDNRVICTTSDRANQFFDDPIECVNVELEGRTSSNIRSYFIASDQFTFGVPRAVAVNPRKASVEFSRFINVTGVYFNGGEQDSVINFFCNFGDLPPVPGLIERSQVDPTESFIICATPTLYQDRYSDLTVGVYPLSITFDCDQPPLTFDRVPFEFIQFPDPQVVGPDEGTELGGTIITIVGTGFLGGTGLRCCFGDPTDDDDDNIQRIVKGFYEYTINPPAIVCISPNWKEATPPGLSVPLFISIDRGEHWTSAGDFFYHTVNPRPYCEVSAAPFVMVSWTMSVLLSAVVALLLAA